MTTEQHITFLRQITDALLEVCDGAQAQDAQGFNKPDSLVVRSAYPDMVPIAPLLLKYKKQIESAGFYFEALKEAVIAVSGPLPIHNWDEYVLGFGKHGNMTYAEMAETQRGYLSWMVQTFHHTDQRWIAATAVLSEQPIPKPKPPAQEGNLIQLVLFKSGMIGVQAPFDAKDRCKALSARRWEKPYWVCPAVIVEEVATAFPDGEQSEGFQRKLAEVRTITEKSTQTTSNFSLEHFGNGKEMMPFQKAGLEFVEVVGGNALIADQMGCISGNAMISINRAGKSFEIRLDRLHMEFNHLGGNWKPEIESPTMARSLMPNKTFRLNKILNVVYKGEKDTVLIRTQSGKELKLTPDHRIRTPVGWVEARTVKIGSKILTNRYKGSDGVFIPKEDIISGIEPAGIQRVFDIVMSEPAHNFIANGIIVHNCGKTVEALSYLAAHPAMRPAVIVCPASLKLNWQREVESWLETNDRIEVIQGGKVRETDADIVIINYDILKKWLPRLKAIEPQILILDESHSVKNPKAARSKAAKELAGVVPHKILLTGTPVLNRPAELWHQLQIIDPSQYSDKRFFRWHKQYADAKQLHFGRKTVWDFSGASNLDELAASLKTIMIRRTKEQVLPELPEKRRQTILIPIDNRKEYDQANDDFVSWMIEQKGAEAAERASHVEQLAKIEYLRQISVRGKMKQAVAWIANFLESGEKLVVFATHRETINTLMSEFSKIAVRIDGGTCMEERQLAVDRFQNDDEIRLFVGNIQAAGVGITLTAASDVAFLELGWTPALHEQAEDRCHRIGQKNAVNIYYILGADTIDQSIGAMLESKREVIDQITGGTNNLGFDLFDLIKDGEYR